jgi:hypothetical protein
LPGTLRDVKPYVRYDRTRVPASDSVFSGLRLNYSGRIAGARYDLSSGVALKLEYRSEKIEGAAPLGTFAAQVSFTFPGGGGVHTLADHEDEVRHRSHDDRRR